MERGWRGQISSIPSAYNEGGEVIDSERGKQCSVPFFLLAPSRQWRFLTFRLCAVSHTWSLRRVGKLQLLVASCGSPLAWAKLCDGESPQAVLNFLSQVHSQATSSSDPNSSSSFPSYIAYDRACDLLREALSSPSPGTYQNPLQTPTKQRRRGSPRLPSFLESSRVVVTGFHLQGHSESDDLCREFCDSAPLDGSAPDLVIPYRSPTSQGSDHRVFVRAFNTSVSPFASSRLNRTDSFRFFRQLSSSTHHCVGSRICCKV